MTDAEAIQELSAWLRLMDLTAADSTPLEDAVREGIEALKACQRAEFSAPEGRPEPRNGESTRHYDYDICPQCGVMLPCGVHPSQPSAPVPPFPVAPPAQEPCQHVAALGVRPGEHFQRCRDCGLFVAPSGVGGGSWVAVTADYGKVTTWKNGVLQPAQEPETPSPEVPVNEEPGSLVDKGDVLRVWDQWRASLPVGAFSHGQGVAFERAIARLTLPAPVTPEPPDADHELAVQLIIRFARGGNEHQLAKARELLQLPPYTFAPNHRCRFCADSEIPLSRHWGDVGPAPASEARPTTEAAPSDVERAKGALDDAVRELYEEYRDNPELEDWCFKEARLKYASKRDALIAAVLADHDAQTRQAFEAGWESGRGRFAESLSTADVSKAYAAYLAAPPAQKGTP